MRTSWIMADQDSGVSIAKPLSSRSLPTDTWWKTSKDGWVFPHLNWQILTSWGVSIQTNFWVIGTQLDVVAFWFPELEIVIPIYWKSYYLHPVPNHALLLPFHSFPFSTSLSPSVRQLGSRSILGDLSQFVLSEYRAREYGKQNIVKQVRGRARL